MPSFKENKLFFVLKSTPRSIPEYNESATVPLEAGTNCNVWSTGYESPKPHLIQELNEGASSWQTHSRSAGERVRPR